MDRQQRGGHHGGGAVRVQGRGEAAEHTGKLERKRQQDLDVDNHDRELPEGRSESRIQHTACTWL